MNIRGFLSRCLAVVMILGLAMNIVHAQYAGGDGSPGQPFQIENQTQFLNMALNPSAAFELIDDITVTEFTGIESFTGQLDGQGHTIHLDISSSGAERNGLFLELGAGSVIRDLRLTGQVSLDDVLFSGTLAADMSGGLIEEVHSQVTLTVAGTRHSGSIGSGTAGLVARKSGGAIRLSSNAGLVRGYLSVGGLVSQHSGGSIERSFNSGTVWATGVNEAGGIVSRNFGTATLSDVYSTGRVTGSPDGSSCFNCGGLIGVMSQGSLVRGYATGFVNSSNSTSGALVGQLVAPSTVNALFFDAETSGQGQGAGGSAGTLLADTGRTTAQMKAEATFTAAGWDFADVWQMALSIDAEAISYPYFREFTYDPFDQVVANSPAPGLVGPARRILVEGPSTLVAGQGQGLRLVARDVRDQPVALYAGPRALVLSGASPAPGGTVPVVSDAAGEAVAFGETVTLTFTDGVAEADGANNGIMTLFAAGEATISATAEPLVTEDGDALEVNVLPAAANRREIERGDGQTGVVLTSLPAAPAVRVFDSFGNPVPGVNVNFAVTAGDGSLQSDNAVTDSNGVAEAGVWTLGPTPGAQNVQATIDGLEALIFVATALPDLVFRDRFLSSE